MTTLTAHLAEYCVTRTMSLEDAVAEAHSVYEGWIAPTFRTAVEEEPVTYNVDARREAVRIAVETSPTVASARRKTGLPKSTFFRYLKELRAEEKA